MLSSLYINNIAVIKEISIDFTAGLTVLTGETGAGKSIIIDAINMILGARVSKDLIRTGESSATVVAIFTDLENSVKERLLELDIKLESDELRIYRQLKSNGKSVCKVGQMPVTATMLKEIGVNLISVQGQHDSHELLNPELHGKYIDNYARLDDLILLYREKFASLKQIKLEIDKLNIDETQKERRIDFLKFQIEEIEEAGVTLGEREALTNRKKIIKESENIARAISAAKNAIDGEDEFEGILSLVGNSAQSLEQVEEISKKFQELASRLRDIEYDLGDISGELRILEKDNEFDAGELEEIEERLALLYKLSLKYGDSEEDMLQTLENSQVELEGIELSQERLIVLSEEFEKIKLEAIDLAKQISQKRKEASTQFSQRVKEELKFLNMPKVEFGVQLERVPLNSLGCDKISFMVSANIGEELKPMSKIASGGELSRIMLAIKTVLSKGDSIGTMIFDEIDAGISGEAGNKVGLKLKEASRDRQILCITHLAQIAAMGDGHLFIEKKSDEKETQTKVTPLKGEKRVYEIARIISGDAVTDLKLQMAKELLNFKI